MIAPCGCRRFGYTVRQRTRVLGGRSMSATVRSALSVLVGTVSTSVVTYVMEALVVPLVMPLFSGEFDERVAFSHNFWARLFIVAYTLAALAFGGYVAAWIARRAPVFHAALVGALQTVITVYFVMLAPHHLYEPPTWKWIALLVLMTPAAAVGGLVRDWQNTSQPVARVAQPS
jgi:hypothetical protein